MTEYGNRSTAHKGLILRTVAGSGALGIAVEGTDDRDEIGIYVEPLTTVLDWHTPEKAYVYRTQPEGSRSGPGDLDYVAYPLRRYVELAMTGNPSVLVPLFASRADVVHTTTWGNLLRENGRRFLSVAAGERFLGYMHSQRERMMGRGNQRRVPNRPELVEKYGWDVKYGAHALRLAYQAQEVIGSGTLTLPMSEHQRAVVVSVKVGAISRDDVHEKIQYIEEECRDRLDSGDHALPPRPDRAWIREVVADAHVAAWGLAYPPF